MRNSASIDCVVVGGTPHPASDSIFSTLFPLTPELYLPHLTAIKNSLTHKDYSRGLPFAFIIFHSLARLEREASNIQETRSHIELFRIIRTFVLFGRKLLLLPESNQTIVPHCRTHIAAISRMHLMHPSLTSNRNYKCFYSTTPVLVCHVSLHVDDKSMLSLLDCNLRSASDTRCHVWPCSCIAVQNRNQTVRSSVGIAKYN